MKTIDPRERYQSLRAFSASGGPAQCQRDTVQRQRKDASRGDQAGHQLAPLAVCTMLVLINCFQMFDKSAQDFRGLMTINVEFFRGKGGHASDTSSPRSLPILIHFWTV